MRAFALLSALALAGCSQQEVTCEALTAELAHCDARPQRNSCDALSATERNELFDSFEARGCDALWKDARVDPRACRAFGWDCPATLGNELSSGQSRHPLLLVSGIDAHADFDWNPRIPKALEKAGFVSYHVKLAPWATTDVRAWDLLKWLRQIPHEKVNLVCYAVGGIDCRYLVSPGGLAADPAVAQEVWARVASITTIATPHRGTAVANALLLASDDELAHSILNAFVGPGSFAAAPADYALRDVLDGLTNESMNTLNETLGDAPGIYYQSYAAVSHVLDTRFENRDDAIERACRDQSGQLRYEHHPETRDVLSNLLLVTAPFASRTLSQADQPIDTPSDGMVSVDSAKWGEFRGCIPADHYDVIGQIGDSGPDPRTGFDAAVFYVNLAADLAARGF
ncbi:MAG: hypothetical protein R3B13_17100 [Polyangiaceae bacterium]